MSCQNISWVTLDEYIRRKSILIVDVRSESEFKEKHIKYAVNITYDEMEEIIDNLIKQKRQYEKKKNMVGRNRRNSNFNGRYSNENIKENLQSKNSNKQNSNNRYVNNNKERFDIEKTKTVNQNNNRKGIENVGNMSFWNNRNNNKIYNQMGKDINDNNNVEDNNIKLVIKGKEIEKNKIVIIYCDRGAHSFYICSKLAELGYNVKSLAGGINNYRGRFLIT